MLARTTFQSDFSFREPFINLQNVVNVLANWIIKKKVCDKNFCNVMKICENCKIVTKAINRLRNYLRFYVRAKITHYSKTFKYFFAIPVFFPVLRLLHFNILYISSANLVHRSVLFGFECGCISLRYLNLPGWPVPNFSQIYHPVSVSCIFSVSLVCTMLRKNMILFFLPSFILNPGLKI